MPRPFAHTRRTSRPPSQWLVEVDATETRLQLREGDQVTWSLELPAGDEALSGHVGIGPVVALANEVHRWLAHHVPDSLVAAVPDAGGCLLIPGCPHDAPELSLEFVRETIEQRLAAGDESSRDFARFVIIGQLLERLGLDALILRASSRTRAHEAHEAHRAAAPHASGRVGVGLVRAVPALATRRSVVTVLAIMLLAVSAVPATNALLNDRIAMAAVTSEGGTLDIKVHSSTTVNQDGPGANWGAFSASLSGMKPGDTRYADITLENMGSLPAVLDVAATGSDQHADFPAAHCFGFWLRERSAATDLQSIGDGAAFGTGESNAGVVGFHPDVPSATLYADGAARSQSTWASGEQHAYRLTVRMLDGCLQGGEATAGATGSVTFTFGAVQA